MRPLGVIALLLVLAAHALPAAAASRPEVERLVVEEALRTGFPPSLAMALAEAASGFRDDARGPGGERGVLQLRPETARDADGARPDELWRAERNIEIGLAYLGRLIARHEGHVATALAHYRSGRPVARPPSQATAEAQGVFVNRVLRLQRRYRREARLWSAALRGEAVDWPELRPDYHRVERLAALARAQAGPTKDGWASAIEARRRAARRHLDDFSAGASDSEG